MRLLMRFYRLGELGHNRAKGLVLVEPMGKQMHADTRQTGHNLDEMPLRLRFFLRAHSARSPFASIEPPCLPQAIDLTEGDSNLPLRFCDRMEHHAAWTGGIVVQQLPKKGLVNFRHFSPSTKCWTRIVHWITLHAMHVSLLLNGGQWHLSSQLAMSIFYTNEIRELAQ